MFDASTQAAAILSALAEDDAEAESSRSLSERGVALLRESGLSRMMAPAAYGGYELSPRALVEANRIVAHGSVAASWVQMVCGAHTFIVGRFPRACQDEVFVGDPGRLVPGVPSSQGTCRRIDGGWMLNGRWAFCSGVDHGDWILLGSRGTPGDDGEPTPGMLVVVPKSDLTVDDTWYTLGMRGTGSKDVIADDVFVPEHRGVRMGDAFLGTVHGVANPLYRLPIGATLSTMALGTIVGIAESGVDSFIDQTRSRVDAYTGENKALRVGLQSRVAEASAEIAHARSLALRNCDLLEGAMERPPPMDTAERAEARWNAAYGNELCRRATDRLFASAGARAAYDANVLQRFFRDINTSTHHGIFDFDTALEMRGKVLLGVEQADALI
jgi:alkylation response protein AidB-like acyl-CoA dehydrogenase